MAEEAMAVKQLARDQETLDHATSVLEHAIDAFRCLTREAGVEHAAAPLLSLAMRARRHVFEASDLMLDPSAYALAAFETNFRQLGADFKATLKVKPAANVREWQVLRGLALLGEAMSLVCLAAYDRR